VEQWIAVLGTALGAVIGLGSAFANDRVRWKREQLRDRLGVRRELYSEYIATLTEIHESMRAVSRADQPDDARRARAIHEAFDAGGPYKLRYQIGVIADQEVLDAAEDAFQQMRDIRDSFAAGGQIEDAGYQALRETWAVRLRAMQRAMRTELGSSAVELRGGS
jgi:hypothetical protein